MANRQRLGDVCLVSPDVGNLKVAEAFQNMLGGDLAFINKKRVSGTDVTAGTMVGSVKGKTVLMMDDMISTGGTVCEAAKVVMDNGAKEVIVAATHGVFAGKAVEKLSKSPISQFVVTNTIPLDSRLDPIRPRLVELCVGELFGKAIDRIHRNQSISELFRDSAGPKR